MHLTSVFLFKEFTEKDFCELELIAQGFHGNINSLKKYSIHYKIEFKRFRQCCAKSVGSQGEKIRSLPNRKYLFSHSVNAERKHRIL